MIEAAHSFRVRYAETDRMGYVYYGNYAIYFEVGRVEALRKLGFSYKEMEDQGILLPVINYTIKYIKPAYYDDLLTVNTKINSVSGARIHFTYETYNEQNVLLNTAETTLVFMDAKSSRPCPVPNWFLEALEKLS